MTLAGPAESCWFAAVGSLLAVGSPCGLRAAHRRLELLIATRTHRIHDRATTSVSRSRHWGGDRKAERGGR